MQSGAELRSFPFHSLQNNCNQQPKLSCFTYGIKKHTKKSKDNAHLEQSVFGGPGHGRLILIWTIASTANKVLSRQNGTPRGAVEDEDSWKCTWAAQSNIFQYRTSPFFLLSFPVVCGAARNSKKLIEATLCQVINSRSYSNRQLARPPSITLCYKKYIDFCSRALKLNVHRTQIVLPAFRIVWAQPSYIASYYFKLTILTLRKRKKDNIVFFQRLPRDWLAPSRQIV